jgi:hypothetical protein
MSDAEHLSGRVDEVKNKIQDAQQAVLLVQQLVDEAAALAASIIPASFVTETGTNVAALIASTGDHCDDQLGMLQGAIEACTVYQGGLRT